MPFADASKLVQHYRELIVQTSIALAVWSMWWYFAGNVSGLRTITEHSAVALTMLIGSFVAGSTSLGGGAVAFPVFTKVLNIDSHTALIFSLAIQSIGMGAASLFIFLTKVPVCYRTIKYSVIFGGTGLVISFFFLRLHLSGADVKYLFSFFSLLVGAGLVSQLRPDRKRAEITPHPWLLAIGCFFGGLLTGIIGTGIDFILFSLMIYCWHYNLKKAIATSVVIMAVNAAVGFGTMLWATDLFTGEVVSYWLAAVPIVVVGAPLGALVCRYSPKNIMLYFLLLLIFFDILSTLLILGIRSDFIGAIGCTLLTGYLFRQIQRRKLQTNQSE